MPRRPKKHPGGRPPLPPGEAKTARLHLALTEEERRAAEALAARHGMHLAEWARRRISHDGADPR